ncbi:MAG: hypothetical protein DWB43_14020 [Lautropia sp.]|nr:MAG: hypothetical protein EDM78_12365 [Pseudomonadota bacterium]MBC6960627.1 hypothetical protein [Lautropia sp.]MCL4703010.1 hypothetical protein [Burkholderiaceae bacterium]MDL1907982.1 hypothetical protein [Betaproteobacteria bacterium PRO1]
MSHQSPLAPQPHKPATTARLVALAVATLALAGCGGGGGGGGTPAPVLPQSISGIVVDGYIAGSTVTCLEAGATVATTTTNASGAFAFSLASGQTCDTVEAAGGIDTGLTPSDPSDDVAAPHGTMRAPVPTGSASVTGLVVSPLSTLVQSLVASGASLDDAQTKVKTALGLPASFDLLKNDPASDAVLFKATSVIGQLIERTVDALAGAGGIGSPAGLAALAGSVTKALAAQLSTLTMAGLTQAPGALTPTSPLFKLLEQAAANAKADPAVAAALQTLNPTTFAALASPIVASATASMSAATSPSDVVDRANAIYDRDRAATILAMLKGLVDNATSDAQGLLGQVAAALAAADSGGADHPFSITIGSETASAVAAAGVSNYAQLASDEVTLYGQPGQATHKLADFEAGSSVTVAKELTRIAFTLQKSPVNVQLPAGGKLETSLAMQVTDATRTFQMIVDNVELSNDATNPGKVAARLLTGARLWVYGKTATSETTSPVVVALSGGGLQIVSTSAGAISFNFDRLFDAIAPSVAPGSALHTLATNRVSSGTYDVTMAIGALRVARATSPTDSTPVLADLHAVTLRAGGQSVTGHGFKGKVQVVP